MFTLTHVVISVLGIIICARHIALRLADAPPRTLVVVDYLQVLDQRRDKPPLEDQVRELKGFARAAGRDRVPVTDQSYLRPGLQALPRLQDVRLPNPLDLSLFDKACFLHGGMMQLLR
jgi:hypothetical protein